MQKYKKMSRSASIRNIFRFFIPNEVSVRLKIIKFY